MTEARWVYRVGKVLLLPFVVLLALNWAQDNQNEREFPAPVVTMTCDQKAAPGEIPSAVILKNRDGLVLETGTRAVTRALEQVLGERDHNLTVVEFCK